MWARLDAVVARPVCINGEERERAIAYVETLSNELLIELAGFLNRFHGTHKAIRYWRILLGHWIHRYTSVLFHRWRAIQQALEDHIVTDTLVLNDSSFHLAVQDTVSFIWACDDDLWNNVLISRVLGCLSKVSLVSVPLDSGLLPAATLPVRLRVAHGRGHKLRSVIDAAARFLQRDGDAFIIGSYLPSSKALMLCLRLGQVPQWRRSPVLRSVAPDSDLRARCRLDSGSYDGFARFARDMIVELLPTCFLEGFTSLKQQAAEAGWPKNPRFIFTSNSFDTDEVFKLWAAEKVEEGCPYITGQHGNNYGTARYCPSEVECAETSDAFITWGWKSDNQKHTPAYIFKTAGRSQGAWNPNGGLLLIERCLPHRVSAWDPYPDFVEYSENQFRFVADLPEEARRVTTVRQHAEYKKQPWCEVERWRHREPGILWDDGTTPVRALIAKNRLVVHSYDSTGILETLSVNIPTLCFWNGGLRHLRDSAVPFYQMLVAAGILQETPQNAAQKVAEVWNDVAAWWASDVVQTARRVFCERYARVSPAPVSELASLLTDVARRS